MNEEPPVAEIRMPWPEIESAQKIHCTALPPKQPNQHLFQEWETYRREVGRLLAEGHEGRIALIQGNEIVELFGTREEARAEGLRRFPDRSFLVHRIREWEPLIRVP